eukprot:8546-Chlamydomonas_euryale.AAC.1
MCRTSCPLRAFTQAWGCGRRVRTAERGFRAGCPGLAAPHASGLLVRGERFAACNEARSPASSCSQSRRHSPPAQPWPSLAQPETHCGTFPNSTAAAAASLAGWWRACERPHRKPVQNAGRGEPAREGAVLHLQ